MGKTRAHREARFIQMSTDRILENTSDESGSGERVGREKRAKRSQGQTGSVGVSIKDHLGVSAIESVFLSRLFSKALNRRQES